MSNTVTVEVFIQTNKIGSKCTDTIEFDREEWDAMSEEKRDEACRDVAFNMGEWGWKEKPL